MSRRSGQNGWIELRNNAYFARFWLDVPGQSKRVCKRVQICPAAGPGSLNASERSRRLKQILEEHGANSEALFREAEAKELGPTFEQQSKKWLHTVQNRRRNPVKLRTAQAWKSHLKYINEQIGRTQLADVNKRSMREFVAKMAAERRADSPRFSAKSIENYLAVIKSVVASVLNEEGEPVHAVQWNHDFMDLPVVEDQRAPSFTATEIETIISKAEGQDRLLYALLAGSGLRIGEAFALRVEDVGDSLLRVRASAWEGTLCDWTKTEAGMREVDLHSSLAEALRSHIGSRTTGLVFPSERGTPLRKSNLLRRSLHPILKEMGKAPCGFHAFRRFRVAHLRMQTVPELLLRIWIGHSTEGITDKYALDGLKRDSLFRTITAQKAGLGFALTSLEGKLPVAPSCARTGVRISRATT